MSPIIRALKEPGSIRILAGGGTVVLLVLAAFLGKTIWPYTPQQMDPDWIMEPPSLKFFRAFLVTKKGMKNLQKTVAFSSPSNQGKDGIGYINDLVDEIIANEEIKPESNSAPSSASAQNGDTEENPEHHPDSGPAAEPSANEISEQENLDYLTDDEPSTSSGHQTGSGPEDLSYLSSTDSQFPEQAQKNDTRHNHYFGTDRDGRDMLALLLAGAKTSLLPGLIACLVALGLGIPLGLIGGYYGGLWESSIQFVNSLALSFPRFVLILVIICALEPNLYYVMLVLGITIIPRVSELIKARVKILNNMGFVLAAKEAGLSDLKIMARHLFWFQNRSVFFIQASLIMSESILVETTLSYLQFGAKPPDVSWGSIIEGSRMAFFSEYYWITFFPAVAIVLAILGFFYLGDGLNARLMSREQR